MGRKLGWGESVAFSRSTKKRVIPFHLVLCRDAACPCIKGSYETAI